MRAFTASSRSSSPVPLCTNTAIGTPQARWRDSTQSGRSFTMAPMRFSAARGYQRVAAMAPSASSRKARLVGAQERLVDAGEPLRRGAVDHRGFGAPGMRIGMADRALGEQRAGLDQFLDHRAIGIAVLAFGGEDFFCPRTAARHPRTIRPGRREMGFRDCVCVPARNRLRHGRARCARSRCRCRR